MQNVVSVALSLVLMTVMNLLARECTHTLAPLGTPAHPALNGGGAFVHINLILFAPSPPHLVVFPE